MRCVTKRGLPSSATFVAFGALIAGVLASSRYVTLDPTRLGQGARNLADFLERFAVVPAWDYLPRLGELLAETLLIAFVGTVGAVLISFPLSFLAANNTSPHPLVALGAKGFAAVLRSLPDLLLALLLASALGLGAVPGVLALVLAAVGFLVKGYAESLEVVDPKPPEAVAAHGGDWLAVRTIGVLPQAAPDFTGLSLYILDVNVRAATILGFVGAGGIGYDLTQAMRLFRFDRLALILLSVYLLVTLIDRASDALRRRLG